MAAIHPQSSTPLLDPPTSSNCSRCSEGLADGTESFKQKSAKVHTGFRISPLVEVFSNLSVQKQNLLRLMKFHFLMLLPKDDPHFERPFNLQFAFWLLKHVDPITGFLELGHLGRIEFKDEDVCFVFGLSCNGEDLVQHDPSLLDSNTILIRRNLLLQESDILDLDTMRTILDREVSADPQHESAIAYMTAVVIYSVSYFLAPKGRPPKINPEVFDSITDPSRILRINWCSYVLKSLKESCFKLKSDMVAGNSSVCLDGCLLFLQIAYLDNIRFPKYVTNHFKIPRVSDFSYSLLKDLIKIDKRHNVSMDSEPFGNFELRRDSESFYTRGQVYYDILKQLKLEFTTQSEHVLSDKIINYLDQKNLEHKLVIRKAAKSLSDHLCTLSDKHCQELKEFVCSFSLNSNINKKPTFTDGDSFSKNVSSGSPNMSSHQSHAEARGKPNYSEQGTFVEPAFLFSQFPPDRHGTKRAANRTPLASRRARQLDLDGGSTSADELGFEQSRESYTVPGTQRPLSAWSCVKTRGGRTKRPAQRKRLESTIISEEEGEGSMTH